MKSEDEIYLHVYDVIEKAVHKALENVVERPRGIKVQEFRPWDGPAPEGTLRLRLDLDLVGKPEDEGQEDLFGLSVTQLAAHDLTDMLVNGDRDRIFDHGTHSLLGMVDGTKKTGRGLASLEVIAVLLYHQYVERKESTEYTGYFAVIPHWEQ